MKSDKILRTWPNTGYWTCEVAKIRNYGYQINKMDIETFHLLSINFYNVFIDLCAKNNIFLSYSNLND